MATHSKDGSDEEMERQHPAKRRKHDDDMEKISDSDINDVANNANLQRDELHHLFIQLDIKESDIENAERRSDTKDFKLQAIQVLQFWRQTNGQTATRKAILDALGKCNLKEAKQILSQMWTQSKANVYPGFDLDACKKELIIFYQYEMSRVQLLPWCDDESKDINEIYVTLKLKKRPKRGNTLLSKNEAVVSLETSNGLPATRVLLKGVAGSGKSTLLAKLAYNWSQQFSDSPLTKYQLLFILSLREVKKGSSLIDEIFNQIFETTTRVSKYNLQAYIQSYPKQVLLLLDGFDEYSAGDISTPVGSLEEILAFKSLRECRTILTTRPHKDLYHQSSYLVVDVLGFSSKNVELYMTKFFRGNDAMVHGLKERIEESVRLTSLSKTPVMLMLMCLLWEDEQKLPDTQTELYQKFCLFLWRKHCTRNGKNIDFSNKIDSEFAEVLSRLGVVALGGLCPDHDDHDIKDETIVFSENDFEKSLFQVGCQIALLTRERLRSKLSRNSAVTFLHKSFQEFCAAMHLANLYSSDPDRCTQILIRLKSWRILLSKIDFLKFLCGLVERSGLVSVMRHAMSVYEYHNHRLSTICIGSPINTTKNILNILALLHESTHIIVDMELAQLFKSIFSEDGFTLQVDDSNPKSAAIFHNFVKSNIGISILSKARSIFIINPQLAQGVIADTLKCMSNVTNVRIHFTEVGKAWLNITEYKTDKIGKALYTLAKLKNYEMRCGTNDEEDHSAVNYFLESSINVLLGYILCSPHRDNYTHIKLSSILVAINDMSRLLSSFTNLESLDLENITVVRKDSEQTFLTRRMCRIKHLSLQCITDGGEKRTLPNTLPKIMKLKTVYGMFRDSLFFNTDCELSNEITHLLCNHIINHHIQVVDLCDSNLTEDHIKILSEHISKACNLQTLDLSRNSLSKTIEPMLRELQYCNRLAVLNLSHSRIQMEHIESLRVFLPKLSKLQVLDLSQNNVGIAFAPLISLILKHCSKLTRLIFSDIHMNAIDLGKLVKYHRSLKALTQGNSLEYLSLQYIPDDEIIISADPDGVNFKRHALVHVDEDCSTPNACDDSSNSNAAVTNNLNLPSVGENSPNSFVTDEHSHTSHSANDEYSLVRPIVADKENPDSHAADEDSPNIRSADENITTSFSGAIESLTSDTTADDSHNSIFGDKDSPYPHSAVEHGPSSPVNVNGQSTPESKFHLYLRGCKLSDTDIHVLFTHIINPHMKVIDFCHAELSEDHIKMLCEFLPFACNMQVLNMSHNAVGMAIGSLLQFCTKLTKLSLSHSQLKEENIKLLIEFLPKASNLQELDLSHNAISMMAMDHLARQLQYCTIRRLNLSNTELDESHLNILVEFLPKASCLRKLNLSDNKAGMAVGSLAEQLQYCTIISLDVSNADLEKDHIKLLTKFLPKASNLIELNLSWNFVGMAIEPLAQQLHYCTIKRLNLSHAFLKERHFKIMSEYLPKASNLQELDLSNNHVGKALKYLVKGLQFCTRLNLDCTQIDDRGIIELSQKFVSMPNLAVLNLNNNNIENTGTDAVFRHIHHLTRLEYLKMYVRLDKNCSDLVKDCYAALGMDIRQKWIKMNREKCQLVQSAASTHLSSVN